jgi:hypothetical protein
MIEQFANSVEGQATMVVIASGVIALALVAFVAMCWWWGKRWVRRQRTSWAGTPVNRFSRNAEVPPPAAESAPPPASPEPGEQWSTRIIRESAQRAAALRATWNRSYQAGRSATPTEEAAWRAAMEARLAELAAEQQVTNALLRDLLDGLRKRFR